MLAEVNATPVAAFQSCSSTTKSDAPVLSENLKHLDPSFDLLATAHKMKSVCRDLLPRLVHGVNAVRPHSEALVWKRLELMVTLAITAAREWTDQD